MAQILARVATSEGNDILFSNDNRSHVEESWKRRVCQVKALMKFLYVYNCIRFERVFTFQFDSHYFKSFLKETKEKTPTNGRFDLYPYFVRTGLWQLLIDTFRLRRNVKADYVTK